MIMVGCVLERVLLEASAVEAFEANSDSRVAFGLHKAPGTLVFVDELSLETPSDMIVIDVLAKRFHLIK